MKMYIKLEEVGRGKFNTIWQENINTDSLQEAVESCEAKAFEEAQKYLYSGIVELHPLEEEYQEVNNYYVCVGDFCRIVGKVIIGIYPEVKK